MLKKVFKKAVVKYEQKIFDTSLLSDLIFVNIGGGIKRIDCAINLDISPKADISVKLDEDPLPFET